MKLGRVAAALVLVTSAARADDVLHLGQAKLDPPTLVALGVVLPITGDDNHNAKVTLRYRAAGSMAWRDALPLYRVRPETVPPGWTPIPQFAGSVFDLAPDTQYELELHAVDPAGAVDQTATLMGRTRAVPRDPKTPRAVAVTSAATLTSALAAAKAGDVITLAPGNYAGNFAINASGTADDPIVIRGQDQSTVVLDGGGCNGCNVLEVYGSWVHIEKLTIAHASRALRFQGQGAEGNVVRRVAIKDVVLGIGSKPDQRDFVLCDNVLEGRLTWPSVYTDDNGVHANDDGIHVEGFGHVVCHNALKGFGDAMKTEQDGARAIDFYGNEVTSAYDNALELDGSEGNVRCFRNRFTNTYATISVQPVYGGPAYIVRNVVVNVTNEQMKFHGLGANDGPSGVLVYHNTFVSPDKALGNFTSAVSHHFAMEDNLFIGPPTTAQRIVQWDAPVDDGLFDYDGYLPDGRFTWNKAGVGNQNYMTFAAAQAGGWETHGLILTAPVFASGLTAPATYKTVVTPADVALANGSNAIDKATLLANINDGFKGAGPDLGALELGCPQPIYGPRPEGIDDTNEPTGCGGPVGPGNDGGVGPGTDGGPNGNDGGPNGGTPGSSGGCGCHTSPSGGAAGALLVLLALVLRSRRKR
jgi:MYXO-CTERM domain-containing protein